MAESNDPISKENEATKDDSLRLLVWLMVGGVGVWIAFGLVGYFFFDCWQNRGLFGDMFGAVNALFSALAFAGVIYAIILQRQELALQREEMRLSRAELAAQNQIIAAQLRTFKESLDFEKTKERLASRPLLVPRSGGSGGPAKHGDFVNHGGQIRDLAATIVAPEAGLKLNFYPEKVMNTGDRGRWELTGFEGKPCPEVILEIAYTNKLSKRCRQRFHIPGGSGVQWQSLGDEIEEVGG